MSEPRPKYITFRDLHTATPKPSENSKQSPSDLSVVAPLAPDFSVPSKQDKPSDEEQPQDLLSSTSSTSSTSRADQPKTSTSRASNTSSTSRPAKNNSLRKSKEKLIPAESPASKPGSDSDATAPLRDFQRVPNSVVRHALSEGIFRGKSKQVWDYFWSVSRGSIIPVRQVRKSRREIQKGAGLGSMVTVDAAIQHLEAVGLIKVLQSVGSIQGNIYEVFTPEEVNPRYTSTTSISRYTSPTQKLVVLDIPESSISSRTQIIENTETYEAPKTFFKTDDEENDDTHTREDFFAAIRAAAKEVCGGVLNNSEQEKARWKELGELLAEELKTAAARAGAVSSPPAFLAAHLRRALKNQRTPHRIEGKENQGREQQSSETPPAKTIGKPLSTEGTARSRFTFEERRRYASNQQPPLGNGWIVESALGKYDEVIEAWLKEQNGSPGESTINASACPDCGGTGMYYPDGYEKGAAKCRHERLVAPETG